MLDTRLLIGTAAMLAFVLPQALLAETRWFVVSEIDQPPPHGDSYLLPLDEPDAIEQARRLIDEGPGGSVGSIATVTIAAGADGLNRDVLAPEQQLWSWHVTEFHGFADATIELCDGWPGFIEEDVDAFIANTQGLVCFWGYTLTAELEDAPPFAIHSGLSGAWFNPATPGQGLMLDVIEDRQELFAAWFTFAEESGLKVGDSAHRWLTAQGPFVGAQAELDLVLTSGGAFDESTPVENSDPGSIGTLEILFTACDAGEVAYRFTDSREGSFPIKPIATAPDCADAGGDGP